VELRAGAGDREAQFSQGYKLMSEADRAAGATTLGASGRSPSADVGLALCMDHPVAHQTATRRCGHLMTKLLVYGCRPWAEEGTALMEKAAAQGHAYAMQTLGCIHVVRKEHEQAVEWFTKGAEAGLPRAMCNLGSLLDTGKGVAAPDHPAAAD
jgi:TPR repeat protein